MFLNTRLNCALIMIAWFLFPSTCFAQYALAPGDLIDLSIVGLPEASTKTIVGVDGTIAVPLVGSVPVAGLSLDEARQKLQSLLPSKEFHKRFQDGHESPVFIAPSEITLSIAEYRPFYITGDVSNPGAKPFRPSITVGEAIAVAGGLDIIRFKLDNPFLQLSDLTADYNRLWVEYASEEAHISRLNTELGIPSEPLQENHLEVPLAKSLSEEIASQQKQELLVNQQSFEKENAYLKSAAQKENDRAKILAEQLAREREGSQADAADLERVQGLFSKGAIAITNLSDARRTVLLSSTRVLQTSALLASVEREKGDLDRRLARLSDDRRSQLLHELNQSTIAMATTRANLQSVSEKLRYTGMVRSQLVRGGGVNSPRVTITRVIDGRSSQFTADLQTELRPGDLIDISLQDSFNIK